MSRIWPAELATYWRSYVPPCRPSRFDLDICSAEVVRIRAFERRRPRVLILGTTNEYRDWAYEEACETTIIDSSREYHAAVSSDRRYKAAKENVLFHQWENLEEMEAYDIIVGDLVIGNVLEKDTPDLLQRIYSALTRRGVFVTKSFFYMGGEQEPRLEELAKELCAGNVLSDPFPYLAYSLTMECRNPISGMVEFGDMYRWVEDMSNRGLLPTTVLDRYAALGWGDGSKIVFQVLEVGRWEQLVEQCFDSFSKETGPYTWSPRFQTYVCRKGQA